MDDFQLDRKPPKPRCAKSSKSYSKEGMTADDAVRTDIEIMREQAKLKGPIPISQVLDYSLLKDVLAEMKK